MIFHEDCALNIEQVLFKGNDAIVIGWVKGDVELSLVVGGVAISGGVIKNERADVAEHFGITKDACFGFGVYTSSLKSSQRSQVNLRLLDKRTATFKDIPFSESEDYSDGLKIIDALKEQGLPPDFFQEGILIDGVKFRLGSHVDRRIAVGHIETVKVGKGGKDALVIGWVVSKSPDNLVLKVGESYLPYDRLYSYPRPDIEEPFSKSFGQNARNGGFLCFSPDSSVKNNPVQLFYCKKSTRTLQLVASTDQIEREVSFEDIQGYLKGVHTPELTLIERVAKIDGPLARSVLRHAEESAYFIRPEVLLGPLQGDPVANIGIVVPKGFVGDVLQSVMSFVALKLNTRHLVLNFFFCDAAVDSLLIRDVAERAQALFDCQVAIFNGCTHLTLGHIGYAMRSAADIATYVIDARSGFEYQVVAKSAINFNLEQQEITMFYSRDINGVSGTGLTSESLDQFCSDSQTRSTSIKPAFSRNRVFALSMNGKTLKSLSQDMGFVPLNELSDLELLIRRSFELSSKYVVSHAQCGLPFARTNKVNQQFSESLARQVEIFTMAQVGV